MRIYIYGSRLRDIYIYIYVYIHAYKFLKRDTRPLIFTNDMSKEGRIYIYIYIYISIQVCMLSLLLLLSIFWHDGHY